jgi:hypothetical protein
MPLIGTWQADGLAPIEAFRISSPSQLSADGKLGGGAWGFQAEHWKRQR